MEGCFLKEWVPVSLSFTGLLFHLLFQLSQLTSQASEQLYWETVMQNTFLTRHYLSWKKHHSKVSQFANLVLMKITRDLHRD